MKTEDENNPEGKIAIVGMACRLPGAKNINEYWNNLVNGLETLSTFTDEELIASGVDPAVFKQPNYIRNRGIIDGAEFFDAEFFGYTPREAELMDPQQRVFLECAWHALEDAGCDPYNTRERIGVFGGTGTPLHLVDAMNNSWVKKNASGASIVTSNDKDYVTTRVSYKLNLTGPSVDVQSACSTSLVAAVTGITSLTNYQSDLIIAGGATIELPEKHGYLYQAGGMESADGHCHTFDKDANGTVFSRGCGVVILKRLEDALRDGNNIYAVILGGAINNDGNKKVGFTAPSVEGQVELITEALAIADISADTITYVEAHGTATPIGDPIEVTSLSESFRKYTQRKQYCAIGSVKTNIGHCDIASGAAGLIKTALCLKYRMIPASLHFKEPNPKIDFPNSPFFVNTELREWKSENGTPLRALVNAFGVGGTNACLILEEPPVVETDKNDLVCDLMLFSGRSMDAVISAQKDVKAFLESNTNSDPHAIAYTSRYGRHHFLNRTALPFRDKEELLAQLGSRTANTMKTGDRRPLVFMFPGQGNQYVNMGLPLYQTQEVYRKTIDECAEILQSELGFDIRSVLYPTHEGDAETAKKINETYVTQPALFIVSYAQAQLLMSLGMKPDMLIGHSVGEYVAATISGVFSLKDALKAVARRGRLVQDLPGGAMLAVLLTEEQLSPILPNDLEVAVVNSPGLCVVSGPVESIDKFAEELSKTKTFNKKIPTSHAFHSAMMEPCLPAFAEFFKEIRLAAPGIPIASTVTGKWMTEVESTNPDFWVKHVRKTVRFADAAKLCLDSNPAVFIESGPGQSLESAVKRQLAKDNPHAVLSTIPAIDNKAEPLNYYYSALGQIWSNGDYFDWTLFDKSPQQLVSYPGYPYERKPYLIDFSKKEGGKTKSANNKKEDLNQWFYIPGWKRSAPPKRVPANGMAATDNQIDKPCWMLFTDDAGLCFETARQLRESSNIVFEVRQGSDFHRNGNEFRIDPQSKEDYLKLFKILKSESWNPTHIIHAWNYSNLPGTGHLSPENAEQLGLNCFYGPMYLEQALISEGFVKNQFLLFVVNHLYNVTGEDVIAPEKALLAGPARVIGQEHTGIISRLADLPAIGMNGGAVGLASALIDECCLSADDTIVAYRHGYRWIEDYTQVIPLNENTSANFTQGGVYLITGGVSGVGMELAKSIAREVNPVLVLTHRSPLPPREEWKELAPLKSPDNPAATRVADIMELESMGATVVLAQLDAADNEGTKKLVAAVEKQHGPVRGVLHSAGLPGAGVIALKDKEQADLVLKSKLHGTLILHDIFKERKLDFFFLFSSVSSIFGEAARIDYCGSNSFMDSFAQYRKHKTGDNTVSINWGQWGVVGMAANWEKTKAVKKQMLQSGKAISQAGTRSDFAMEIQSVTDDQIVCIVDIHPEKDWILSSHRLSGKPAFIGISAVEILNRYIAIAHKEGNLDVQNLNFVTPLIFDAGVVRKIRLTLKPSDGLTAFRISSKEEKGDSAREIWMDHVKGEFRIVQQTQDEMIRVDDLIQRIAIKESTSPHFLELLNDEGKPVLKYDNRWDCKKRTLYNGTEFLAEIRLREEFLEDLRYFQVHPAMMDVATSCCIQLVDANLYLPYAYRDIRIHHPLPSHFWAYLKLSADWKIEDEEMPFEVKIISPDNKVILSIGKVSFKRLKQTLGAAKPPDHEELPLKPQSSAYYAGKNDILPEEGVEVFKKLISFNLFPQVVVSTTDLNQDIIEERPSYKKKEKQEKEEEKHESSSTYERPQLTTPYEAPTNEIEITVTGIWQGILGIDKIGINDTFMELGGNSLLAIQTISNIADEFDLELQPAIFFENPTVKSLSERIVEMIIAIKGSDEIEAMLKEIENE